MLGRMERAAVQAWIERYERAWRTSGTDMLADLFTDDVEYLPSPWADPIRGLAVLGRFWEAEREGPAEEFTMTAEIVAVDGDVGVVRVDVDYGSGSRWRDLWIVRLDEDGRCAAFEEWPFAPNRSDRPLTAPD
jgi:ketosteroid isomerase-like protein